MQQSPMPEKNVGAQLKQKWPDETVKLHLKGKLSEIERNIIGHTKFIADNFDNLYEEDQLLQNNLAATEKKLHNELDSKLTAILDMLTARLDFQDGRTLEVCIKLEENKKLREKHAEHLDHLQNQVGVLDFRFH